MNPADPLAALHDIHLPPPVSWWPLAPGWWILSALLLVTFSALLFIGMRRWRQRAYRRQALRDLRAAYLKCQSDNDAAHFQQHTQRLLKQTALVAYPHNQVANLHGDRWLQFLDRPLRRSVFMQPDLQPMADMYRADTTAVAAPSLYNAARLWIRKH